MQCKVAGMKKIFIVTLAVCVMVGSLFGCTKDAMSEIAPKELTQDQKDIVSLLSSEKNDILLFEYKTKEAYTHVEFWAEIYENGVLVDTPASIDLYSDNAELFDGQFVAMISQNAGFQWTFTISGNGSRVSHTSEPVHADYGTGGRAYGPIDGPVAIQGSKEIILYTSIFSSGSIATQNNMQIYAEQPNLLSKYPYVHVIKCKFTK